MTITSLDAVRAERSRADERRKVEMIFGHIAKELSWEAYKMLKDGKVLRPASHDESMCISEIVYASVMTGFRDLVAEHYG